MSGSGTESAAFRPAHAGVRIGHVHLRVADIERALAEGLKRVLAAGVPLEGAAYHGVSEAVYLREPDGNGVELYWDRPESDWPRDDDGKLAMYTRRLDLEALLALAEP